MLHVQKAKFEHISPMCQLLKELFHLEKDFTHIYHSEKLRTGLELILNRKDSGQIFVLIEENQVIGMANLLFTISTAEGGKAIILEDYIISSTNRGKGYGSFFMREIIQYARNNGFLRITLLVDSDNSAAQRFYEKAGYQHSNMKCMRLIMNLNESEAGQ